MQDVRLKIGDILLVRCPESALENLRRETDFIIVEDVHHMAAVDFSDDSIAAAYFASRMATGLKATILMTNGIY